MIDNPGITGNGSIALAGECWDANGNKLLPGSVVLRIVNGAIATVAITQTTIAPVGAGATQLTLAGVAAVLTRINVVVPAVGVGALAMAGAAPTLAVG